MTQYRLEEETLRAAVSMRKKEGRKQKMRGGNGLERWERKKEKKKDSRFLSGIKRGGSFLPLLPFPHSRCAHSEFGEDEIDNLIGSADQSCAGEGREGWKAARFLEEGAAFMCGGGRRGERESSSNREGKCQKKENHVRIVLYREHKNRRTTLVLSVW